MSETSTQTPTATQTCKMEKCKRPYRAKGFCNVHFKKWRRGELPKKARYKTCAEEKCKKPLFKWGKCEEHFKALTQVAAAPEAAPVVEAAPALAPAAKEEPKEEAAKE